MKTKTHYLAYGMNTNLNSMRWRCPSAESLGKVTLDDHRLVFKRFCDAEYTPGHAMECALWTITEDCERSLDKLEGYPEFYNKKEVTVKYNNKNVRAMIYFMPPGFDLDVPGEGYLNTVTEGYSQHSMDILQIVNALEDLTVCKSY
jgi:gamma-glutamylcyclotransferase (GGCT)/AIG2-like uncharacterized protein YtfP